MNEMTRIDLFAPDSLFRTKGYILDDRFVGESFLVELTSSSDYTNLTPLLNEIGGYWHDPVADGFNPYDRYEPEINDELCLLMIAEKHRLYSWMDKSDSLKNDAGIDYEVMLPKDFKRLYLEEYNRVARLTQKPKILKSPYFTLKEG